MDFANAYEDSRRAESYAKLRFPGTYYLAYRDLPKIITRHVRGNKAIDFGCGTGRSTRFLRGFGFETIGLDIARDMIDKAREIDAAGNYHLIEYNGLNKLESDAYNLVLSAFTFDNIPTMERKVRLFRELSALLKAEGRIINLVSSPNMYTHEWASFTTRSFPENHHAKSGDKVRIIMTDVEDRRPIEDILWTDRAYREVYRRVGLEVAEKYMPLAKESEPFKWVNETRIAPWVIYVLKK